MKSQITTSLAVLTLVAVSSIAAKAGPWVIHHNDGGKTTIERIDNGDIKVTKPDGSVERRGYGHTKENTHREHSRPDDIGTEFH